MNKITIDNITEQQLEDMIEIIKSIKYSWNNFNWNIRFDDKNLTLRAQETFKLIRNQ